jgi:hypothetical protein
MSYISGNTVPGIGKKYGIGSALGVGAIVNFLSFIISLILIKVDRYAVKHDEKILTQENQNS